MKKWIVAIAAAAVALPALAAAPKALQIYMNQRPYQGKAIWYKDEIYVPLKDVVRNTGGSFQYNHTTGVVHVSLGAVQPPPPGAVPLRGQRPGAVLPGTTAPAPNPNARPRVEVSWDARTLYTNNAKVVATFQNRGDGPAVASEVVCVFMDGMRNVIGSTPKVLGPLQPNESRTLEFWLFDPATTTNYAGGYYGGYGGFGGGTLLNSSQDAFARIYVGTYQTQINYDFRISYR